MTIKANVVSRYLTVHGHDRSETETTQIRGWTRTYPGFRVEQINSYTVRVNWEIGDAHMASRSIPRVRKLEVIREHVEAMAHELGWKYRAQVQPAQQSDRPDTESYVTVTTK